jgi:predicted nucleotidyltransferase
MQRDDASVARNEAREDSDVDLLMEPLDRRFSIFDLVRVRDLCRTILGTTADIHDYDGLRRLPEFQRRVSGDLVRVF